MMIAGTVIITMSMKVPMKRLKINFCRNESTSASFFLTSSGEGILISGLTAGFFTSGILLNPLILRKY